MNTVSHKKLNRRVNSLGKYDERRNIDKYMLPLASVSISIDGMTQNIEDIHDY
jgi:archaellum component FlaF (FlaF/FlaG flagellin family)